MIKDVLIASDQVLYNWQSGNAIRKQVRLVVVARNLE
jgi:hypothetical protein